MTTPYQTEFLCPNCGTVFETTSLMSTNSFGPQTTDLYRMAAGAQPLPYLIHLCPSCGYTGSWRDFKEDARVAEPISALVAEHITPLLQRERPHAGRRYEFAAWIAGWRGEPPLAVGKLYQRAAWCSWREENPDEERYRRQTINHFEQALAQGDIPAAEAATYTYLIGELYRRVAEEELAHQWFDRVLALEVESGDDLWLKELAEQQKIFPQEFIE